MIGGTLDTLKALFFDRLKKGECMDCPVCGRLTKIYKRRLHTSIALQLIQLYRLGGASEFVHASQLIGEGVAGAGDFTKAKYWNLIEPMHVVPDSGKKSSGYWMLTLDGKQFVEGERAIQEFALLYDDKVLEFSGRMVSIDECLGEKFDYSALMSQPLGDLALPSGGSATATSVNGEPL